jgi:hypothetical protein
MSECTANASIRSPERHEQEMAYLRRKWGPYLDALQAKGTTRLVVRMHRRTGGGRTSSRVAPSHYAGVSESFGNRRRTNG